MRMMESFLKIVKNTVPLSDGSIKELSQICAQRSFGKNDFVLKETGICNDIYFVSSGLLRIFYFKEDKDISEWFAFENSFCFSIISYFRQVPSKLIIQCLEDSEIIFIPREGLNTLRNSNFEIANYAYTLISGSLIASQERMAGQQFETAFTRYEKLIKQQKNFILRVPLHYIASYLGVSAETLSRIRAQIH
jgi:CRP-like cAMP-binding protein